MRQPKKLSLTPPEAPAVGEQQLILFYFDDTVLGPSQGAILALLDGLPPGKFAYRALVPTSVGPLPDALRAGGIEPDVLAMPATFREAFSSRGGIRGWSAAVLALLGYYRKLFRYFKMYNFGVVHSDGLRAHLLSIGIKVRFNVPLLWHLWAIIAPGLGLRMYCMLAAVFSDHVVTSSLYVAHQLGRSVRWRRRMSALYRGYDRTFFQLRAPAEVARPLLCALASGENASGYKTFLLAFAQARRTSGELRAVVLVEGSDPALITIIEDFGRSLKIDEFLSVQPIATSDGARGIGPELTRRAVSVYVNASVDLAPFHSDVAEAMGMGVPVVCSRIGVLAELVVTESTGLLFTPGDARELAETLLRLLGDETLRARLTANARQEFIARFGVEGYVAAIVRIYGEHLADVAGQDAQPAGERKVA